MGRYIQIFILLLAGGIISAQTKTNLEQMIQLVEASAVKIDSALSQNPNEINLSFLSTPQFQFFEALLIKKLVALGYSIKHNDSNQPVAVKYNLLKASTGYGEIFSDGIFGSHFTRRNVSLYGSVLIERPDKPVISVPFNLSVEDTVEVDKIKDLEDPGLPATQSVLPPPSLFSNLLEPIIVVGTLITTVILLFTIRSK